MDSTYRETLARLIRVVAEAQAVLALAKQKTPEADAVVSGSPSKPLTLAEELRATSPHPFGPDDCLYCRAASALETKDAALRAAVADLEADRRMLADVAERARVGAERLASLRLLDATESPNGDALTQCRSALALGQGQEGSVPS